MADDGNTAVSERTQVSNTDDADNDIPVDGLAQDDEHVAQRQRRNHATGRRRFAVPWTLLVAELAMVAVFTGLIGWFGYRIHESRTADEQHAVFLQAGRQGALNLTTIDYTRADANIQRIIDGSTGRFRKDFQNRSAAFVEVVKHAKSRSEGTITEAGLESSDANQARVLVAVSVKTSLASMPEPEPRAWRMRITVQKDGDDVKVSNVEFVP